jgi:hypothetical protein
MWRAWRQSSVSDALKHRFFISSGEMKSSERECREDANIAIALVCSRYAYMGVIRVEEISDLEKGMSQTKKTISKLNAAVYNCLK